MGLHHEILLAPDCKIMNIDIPSKLQPLWSALKTQVSSPLTLLRCGRIWQVARTLYGLAACGHRGSIDGGTRPKPVTPTGRLPPCLKFNIGLEGYQCSSKLKESKYDLHFIRDSMLEETVKGYGHFKCGEHFVFVAKFAHRTGW